MGNLQTYRDLIVWQKAKELALDAYKVTRGFPKEEQFGLISQIRRSAVSISSNIAEGYGRQSTVDYVRFLQISRGSLYELKTQLEIAHDLNYSDAATFQELQSLSLEIEKMLNTLIKKLKAK
jgi:four helix bundle protein